MLIIVGILHLFSPDIFQVCSTISPLPPELTYKPDLAHTEFFLKLCKIRRDFIELAKSDRITAEIPIIGS